MEAIRWHEQDESALVDYLQTDFKDCDGLTAHRDGDYIVVTAVFVKVPVELMEKYEGEKVRRPLIYCPLSEVVRDCRWGKWLTPLDPERYEWEDKHVNRKVIRWGRSTDYIYSEVVTRGMLGWLRRMHWQEYIDDTAEYDWEVKTCHEVFRSDSPWVLLKLDPACYNRSTRIRLRHYLSD